MPAIFWLQCLVLASSSRAWLAPTMLNLTALSSNPLLLLATSLKVRTDKILPVIKMLRQYKNVVIPAWMPESRTRDGIYPWLKNLI